MVNTALRSMGLPQHAGSSKLSLQWPWFYLSFSENEDILLFIFLTPGAHTLVARKGKRRNQKRRPVHRLFSSDSILHEKALLLDNTQWEYFQSIFRCFPMTRHQFIWVDSFPWLLVSWFLAGNLHGWVRKGTPPIPKSKEAFWATVFNKKSPCLPFSWKELIRNSLMKINISLKWALYLIPHQLSGKWLCGSNWISSWIWLIETATWWKLKTIFALTRCGLVYA